MADYLETIATTTIPVLIDRIRQGDATRELYREGRAVLLTAEAMLWLDELDMQEPGSV
ncbi:hypothetical protein [Actinocrispum wychmicini]|uniref:hypothetical protein n=1 Tax=Actinocrispum wychmicini TaxID=1213861 RepID=UPI0014043B97|nr:hypothetical protein [Actinocrispum wychmicini]